MILAERCEGTMVVVGEGGRGEGGDRSEEEEGGADASLEK